MEQTVGFIGVGNMGGRMSRRVLDRGFELVGHDLDPARLDSQGVPAAESVAALVQASDVIFLSLPNTAAVTEVISGPGGVAESCRAGQVVVDTSTVSPEATRANHERLEAVGVELLDAGISGGAAAAERGTLTVMVGGSQNALDEVRDVMECFASAIFHMGGPGSGHTAKLINNFLNGVSLAATAEAMVAAKKAGLDVAQLLDVINSSSGVNFATLNRFPRIVQGDYLEGGLTGELMAKDIVLYMELTQRLGVTSLNGPSCLASFVVANSMGYGDKISNRVVDAFGDLAGGIRLQGQASDRGAAGTD